MDDSPVAFVARWTEALRSLQSAISAPFFVASPSGLASLTSDAQALGVQLTEQAEQLPAYELGRCERELKSLLESISAAKTKSTAKPKFSFKRTAASSSLKPSPSPSSPTLAPFPPTPSPASSPQLSTPPPIPATSLALSARRDEFLSLSDLPPSTSAAAEERKHEALLLSALEGCFVDLTRVHQSETTLSHGELDAGAGRETAAVPVAGGGSSVSALYLYNLKRCVVLVEPIAGSVMLHGCEDCLIVLGCHQFRMHDSTNCRIFLQITSTPIIERCRGLLFGPYPPFLSPLSLTTPSSFADVQDFDHPFASTADPSPNFRTLELTDKMLWDGDACWQSAEQRRREWHRLIGSS